MKKLWKYFVNIGEDYIQEITSLCDKKFITPSAHQMRLLATLLLWAHRSWGHQKSCKFATETKPLCRLYFPPLYCFLSQPPHLLSPNTFEEVPEFNLTITFLVFEVNPTSTGVCYILLNDKFSWNAWTNAALSLCTTKQILGTSLVIWSNLNSN